MKFKLRRFMASLVAIAIIVTMIFSKVTVSFAASSRANVSLWYASTSKVGVVSELKAGYDHGEVFYAMIDGNSAPDVSASYDYYESVRDKIDKSYNAKVPSFSSKDKSDAKTYELKWNEDNERFEITLTDSNKSLSNYDFTLSGYKVEKSGNNITIYTTSVDTSITVGTFKSNIGAVKTVGSCVYWVIDKSNYQEFISEKPEVEAVKSYIKVKTQNIGYGKITKKDETTGERREPYRERKRG